MCWTVPHNQVWEEGLKPSCISGLTTEDDTCTITWVKPSSSKALLSLVTIPLASSSTIPRKRFSGYSMSGTWHHTSRRVASSSIRQWVDCFLSLNFWNSPKSPSPLIFTFSKSPLLISSFLSLQLICLRLWPQNSRYFCTMLPPASLVSRSWFTPPRSIQVLLLKSSSSSRLNLAGGTVWLAQSGLVVSDWLVLLPLSLTVGCLSRSSLAC